MALPDYFKVLGLTGLAQSGKDTAASFMRERGWTRFAFADPLKEVAKAIGWDGKKLLPDEYDTYHEYDWKTTWAPGCIQGRALLQELGVAVRDHVHPDAWVMACEQAVLRWDQEHHDDPAVKPWVVITDVRFQNEYDWIHENGGCVVRIERPGTPQLTHVSERFIEPDVTLPNDGDLDLLRVRVLTMAQLAEGGDLCNSFD